MSLIDILFGEEALRNLPAERKQEVKEIINKLMVIGKQDDFLSVVPGGPFDHQCHHRQAKDIGRRLNAIGGLDLMMAVRMTIRRKLKDILAEHLDHCWKDIGDWQA
ncbi:MAG: hypothetical protein GYA81_08640 [Chloroflexi bacterium]|nr:hypothetical protein [Chloroflexota bacterium]